MRNGIKTMDSMFAEVTDMQASFNSINSAVEVQVSNGAQVLTALVRLRETTDQVRTGSKEIQKESASIRKVVENLKNIFNNMNESIHDVQEASKKIANSLDTARKIAEGRYLMPVEDADLPE